MEINYIKNPRTIKLLGIELKKICDDYWTGKITEQVLKDYVYYVAKNHQLIADNGRDLNITVKFIVGKKRVSLILKMLEGYQLQF